ncbi:MAG: iron-containing redox enzyme family protein, partial [Glaciihabitans sp.]|nr:iron-containing redox enzyme family protein [Glaciihabitans sp.]
LLAEHPRHISDDLALDSLVDDALNNADTIAYDEDLQLSLFILYGLHYGIFEVTAEEWEWEPSLIVARGTIERAFEAELRARIPLPELPLPTRSEVAKALNVLTAADGGPSLSRFVHKKATLEQMKEFLVQRSIYTLREADPHSWAIPRLTGRPKAALLEIQADEYGGGNADRMHSEIFARTMRACGLDSSYGHYVNDVPAITLASLNMMSMFGLNRRLRGAIVGHLAAFEMTSSIPNRMYGNGFRRLGFNDDVTEYFDEHVEADAVHEQIASFDLAGSLAEDDPRLLEDIFFGASACLVVDGWAAQHLLESWQNDRTSLRVTPERG